MTLAGPAVRGPLRPSELAQASVMAALSAATAILSVVVPFAAGLSLLGTVPMGLLAYRYRLRVLIAAMVAGGMIAFLVAGLGGLMTVVHCAYIGGLTGIVKRRGRGIFTVILASLAAGVVVGAGSVGALIVLSRLRQLLFDSLTASMDGATAVIAKIPHLAGFAGWLQRIYDLAMQQWPWLISGSGVISTVGVSLIGWWALSRVLARLSGVPDVHKLEPPVDNGPIGPVPLQLRDVRFRYPGVGHDALGPLTVSIEPGEHVAVTGPNGSGKTTLMLMIAGRQPAAGAVERPGSVGLGKIGGTAVIMQHPDSQVLGTRVGDDVVWGLPPGTTIDVERLLEEVGLAGLSQRETDGLSGGELQRLAVAAALAREPSLLIADEVTSMVDRQGREALLSVLSGLRQRHRMALVHITHYDSEAALADRTIALTPNAPRDEVLIPSARVLNGRSRPPMGGPLMQLIGIGHEYGSGTPWATTALRDVNFTVHDADGVLIHGGNASGKSTLAWIMSGLTVPTTGTCLLDGRPVSDQVGAVALSFQAARLQLMRGRVDQEIAAAAGFSRKDTGRVETALATVGLDRRFATRRIDQLSGGETRRVVLAGLLARSPRALILDEPLAGLDTASAAGLVELLEDLRQRTGLTVIVISRDVAELDELCPRVLHLHDGALQPAPATTGGQT
jgi:energy-coupling factor transport system ATP-binding protein